MIIKLKLNRPENAFWQCKSPQENNTPNTRRVFLAVLQNTRVQLRKKSTNQLREMIQRKSQLFKHE